MRSTWFRLDVHFWSNPKILDAIERCDGDLGVAVLAQVFFAINVSSNRKGRLTPRDVSTRHIVTRVTGAVTHASQSTVTRWRDALEKANVISSTSDGGILLVGFDDDWCGQKTLSASAGRSRAYRARKKEKGYAQ